MMKKLMAAVTAAASALVSGILPSAITTAEAANTTMRDMTTQEIVKDMGLGINLGNTFESSGDWIKQWGSQGFPGTDPRAYETAWGSPVVTKDIFKGYAAAGFDSVRIPVAWSNLMSEDGTYTISSEYMAEVKKNVDWALDEGLYVIMNLHWDGGWLENLPTNKNENMKHYTRIWEQLVAAFKDYGDMLIFESQNEELGWNSVWNQWSGSTDGKAESYGLVNEVNQKFVDIVRNSGGNNAKRHLLISGYGTDVHLTCDSMFKMPSDPANRCAVSVHYYIPSPFAILEEDADWAKAQSTWGTDAEVAELNSNMDLLKRTFVDKGIPVIIGEYGCPTNNKDVNSVRKFLSSVAEESVKRDMCPVLWDITDLHYDRSTYKVKDAQVQAAFDRINETYFAEDDTPSTPSQPTTPDQPQQPDTPSNPTVSDDFRSMSTQEIVTEMGLGINLGNTFESSGDWIKQWGSQGFPGTDPRAYETAWGSPVVTKDIFKGYAAAGFKSVRIPVAWSNLMSEDGTYTISSAYLAEVKQSIDWALDEGLYVIMNLHWDGGWLENLPTNKTETMKHYTRIWEQLVVAFRDYGDKLIFESQNEELGWNSVWNQWSGSTNGKAESYGLVNEVNQTFVDIVRNSGGNNSQRHLLISGYGTDVGLTCDSMFKMPSDPANHCAVSVHYYTPSTFAILEKDEDWGKAQSTWGTDAEVAELNNNMDLLKRTFVDKGIPVIIGEYGCPTNNKDINSVRKFLSSVAEEAVKRDMCPVLWDVTDLHYDRSTYKMKDAQVQAAFDRINEQYFGGDTQPVFGDINGDGSVTIIDAVLLQKHLVCIAQLNSAQLTMADVNHDNVVNVFDLAIIKNMIHKF